MSFFDKFKMIFKNKTIEKNVNDNKIDLKSSLFTLIK